MTKLEIISKLCEVSTNPIGMFNYDGTECSIKFAFGPVTTIQVNTSLEEGRYMYDYECLLGSNPDACLFIENYSIGLYRIEEDC